MKSHLKDVVVTLKLFAGKFKAYLKKITYLNELKIQNT